MSDNKDLSFESIGDCFGRDHSTVLYNENKIEEFLTDKPYQRELVEDIIKNLEKKGITLVISHANEQPLQVFKKSGLYNKIGAENFCPNIESALERAEKIAR